MNGEIYVSISVPIDDEGCALLRCEYCESSFKGTPDGLQDDGVLHIFCPGYGLISDSYITDDVLELAIKMATSYANGIIYDVFKNLEYYNKINSMIKLRMKKKPHCETKDSIRSGVEVLEICTFPYCKCTTKIKPLLKMTDAYCPFYGAKNYEIE